MRLIQNNPTIAQQEMKEELGVSLATVKRLVADLQKNGKIQRQGSKCKGIWMIVASKE